MGKSIRMIKKETNYKEINQAINKIENETNLRIVNLEEQNVDDSYIAFLVCEKFFFRVASYVSVSILIVSSNNQTSVSIVGSGGGYTPLNVSFGANNKIVKIVKEAFEELGYKEY